jgi:hypothetical protein
MNYKLFYVGNPFSSLTVEKGLLGEMNLEEKSMENKQCNSFPHCIVLTISKIPYPDKQEAKGSIDEE